MKVQLSGQKKIFFIHWNNSAIELIKLFYDYTLPLVNIINDDNRIIGTAVFSDMFKLLFPDYGDIRKLGIYLFDSTAMSIRDEIFVNKKIKHLLSENSEVVNVDMQLQKVFTIMKTKGLTQLPVVENGKLIGVITINVFSVSPNFKSLNNTSMQFNS